MIIALLFMEFFTARGWGETTTITSGCLGSNLKDLGLFLLSPSCPFNPFGHEVTITSSLDICQKSSTCQSFNVGSTTYYSLGKASSCGVCEYNKTSQCENKFNHYWPTSYTISGTSTYSNGATLSQTTSKTYTRTGTSTQSSNFTNSSTTSSTGTPTGTSLGASSFSFLNAPTVSALSFATTTAPISSEKSMASDMPTATSVVPGSETPSGTPSATPSATITPTSSLLTASTTSTSSLSGSVTFGASPSNTPTESPSGSLSIGSTPSNTPTESPSGSLSIGSTPSNTPTSSPTSSFITEATPSNTPTPSPSGTLTPSVTGTSASTTSPTATPTTTPSPTPSPSPCGCGQGAIPVPPALLPYGIVAASAITGGAAVITGGMAISPSGVSSVTFFPPATYTGALDAANPPAVSAQTALTALTLALRSAPGSGNLPVSQLGSLYGVSLLASSGPQTVFNATTSLLLDGSLTLTGGACDQFYFLAGSTIKFSTVVPFTLTLLGGLQAANVFWVAGSSITLEDASQVGGILIAQASITFTGGGSLEGSAFASTATVTLAATIVNEQCFVNPVRRSQRRGLSSLPVPQALRQTHLGEGELSFRCPPGYHWLAIESAAMGVCEEDDGQYAHPLQQQQQQKQQQQQQQQRQQRGLQGVDLEVGGCPTDFLDPATGTCGITDVSCSQPGGVYNPLTAQCTLPASILWVATTQYLLLTASLANNALPPPFNKYISMDAQGVGAWSVSGICGLSGTVSTSPQAILTSLSTVLAFLSSLQGFDLTLQFSPSITQPCAFTVSSNSTLALSQVCILLAASDFAIAAAAAAATTPTQLSLADLTALFAFVGLSTSDAAVLGVTLLGAMENSGSGVTALSLSPLPSSALPNPPTTPSIPSSSSPSSSPLTSGPIVGIFLASLLMAILLAVLTLRLRKQWSSSSSSSSNNRSYASTSLFSQRPPNSSSINPEGRGGATAEAILSPTNATAAGSSGTLRRRGGVGASGSSGGAKGVEVHDN